jgi:flavin reductase (DIM6/NTAB) family NADH-FMN oxidoreductase RutF
VSTSHSIHGIHSTIRCTAVPQAVPQTVPPTATHVSDPIQHVMDKQATGVAVVTSCHRGTPTGLLVTSLTLVSNQPPQIMFSISATSSGWPALEQAEHLGIHLLAAGQEELAERFRPERSDGFSTPSAWQSGPYGVPILGDCAAWAVARPHQRVHAGDHVIIVARLIHGEAHDDVPALVTQAGSYHSLELR